VFHVEPKPAIAMSLVVVGMSALVGFITHWQQGTINVRIALGFGALAMTGSFGGARLARFVPAGAQLLLKPFTLAALLEKVREALK